ncbi:MAG: MarR family transcriptional regulator [Solirubrobacterales bacterium]|nr:MarR family transcriptional regulator [Solirubrobacterales bacterium]
MTANPQNDSGILGRRAALRASPDGSLDEDLEQLVATLPRRISHLSRVLYRTRGSALPRGMRSVVFTLAFGPLRISEIAREEGIGQPAATRMVARLEALGLVRRERSATDRRIVMVTLTDRGRAELDGLRAQSRRLLREALRGRSARGLRRMEAASEALALLTEWTLEQERRVEAEAKAAQSTSAAASRRNSRRALRS